MNNIKKFFANGLLLTLSALIMRSISVKFGAYVAAEAGTEAMGLFGLIMSVFGFALTIATSGVNLAVTRMVSEAIAQNDFGLARMSLKKCIKYCLFCSVLAGSLLFILARPIGDAILKDSRTVMPLKILALSLPFISVSSALGGYFTAVRRVYKNTLWQVSEQFIKMYFTVKFFILFIHRGIEYACIALVAADAISELSAFLFSAVLWFFDQKKHIPRSVTSVSGAQTEKKLYSIALPVALSTYIRSGLLTIEHILIPRGLMKSGLSKTDALSSYGILHSMVMPVLLFPTAVISSFSGLLIPELSDAAVKNEKARVQSIVAHAFRACLIFSFGVAGIFLCFSDELGILIYDSSEAGHFMRLLAPLIPVMYLDGVTDAMLKGLGEQVYSMNVNIIDALMSILFVVLLLPGCGINGYVITIYITELVNASLSIARLLKVTGLKTHAFRWLFLPLLSVLGAVSAGRAAFQLIPLVFPLREQLIIFGFAVTCLYLLLARITRVYDKSDLKRIKSVFRS